VRFDLGAKPHLGYTGSVVERAADLRQDPAAIATLEADARARTFVISGEFVIARKGTPFNEPTFPLGAAGAFAPAREQVFLGRNGDAALFAMAIDPETAEPLRSRSDLLVTDLRSLATGALVAPEHLPPLAEAKSLLGWHRRHRFCSNCGASTRLVQAGWRRDCAACEAEHFHHHRSYHAGD
jgi:NAD+ diphosphatase